MSNGKQRIFICRKKVELFILGILCGKGRSSKILGLAMNAFGFF